jgi:hypothetical protein
MVLLASVHAALQSLGRPVERPQYPRGQARTLRHVWVAAEREQTEVVQPAGTQQQLAIARSATGKALGDHKLAHRCDRGGGEPGRRDRAPLVPVGRRLGASGPRAG